VRFLFQAHAENRIAASCILPPANLKADKILLINIPINLIFQEEDDIISPRMNQTGRTARAEGRSREGMYSFTRYFLLIFLSGLLFGVPVAAGEITNTSSVQNATNPEIVNVGLYIMDFNNLNVADGAFEANFYLILSSDTPLSIDDIQIMNGRVTSIETIVDTPELKNYRIVATISADPDLHLYPFDKHTLSIQIKPKHKPETEMVFIIDKARTGLDAEANLPGWEFTTKKSSVTNKSFLKAGEAYSRAVFDFGVERDSTSTLLKFFLPIFLIVLVSLSSLLMKVSSRLGLNASMFLAAVMIHWRLGDIIPLVTYATFLDLFMMITYATLVMVLISGILIMKFTEAKDTVRVEQVHRWSLRIIPPLAIGLYILVFLSLLI